MGTRGRHVAGVVVVLALCLLGSLLPVRTVRAVPDPEAGLVPADEWADRQDDFLEHATSMPMNPSSPLSMMAYAERARRDPGFDGSVVATASPADFSEIFDKLAAFRDTGDFDINRLITLLLRYRYDMDPALAAAVEDRILAFKYWWTEPTPDGMIDHQYYWTENHLIIFAANEYIAGQAWRDTVFKNSGMTGQEHMDHALPHIRRWMDLRSRFGFSEWLSNVYWMDDLMGVLLLAEFADDPVVSGEASMLLDIMFVELASHLQNGSFGATHGRSYMKDKLTALDEDTFSLAKMVFDDTDRDYPNVDTATLLAVADGYRPPEVARQIAQSTDLATIRQHQSLPLDPYERITANPVAPYGLTYEGEDALMVWWSMGAFMSWQIAAFSAEFVENLDLWRTSNFAPVAILEPIAENSPASFVRFLARLLAPMANAGLLSEVDTSTWRAPEVMLSAAQDWRPGQRSEQVHMWQATLDADALVFTNHPREGVPASGAPNEREGYWTGEATIPRVAHHERSLVAVYAPQYPAIPFGSGGFGLGYEHYTHAFFPTERFDEVVERDGWVIGRLGDGYVAIWSWRPARWRAYDETEHTRGLSERFDLVARGGADNVWITEVARAEDFAGAADPFAAFVDAVVAIEPKVTPFTGAHPCPTLPWFPNVFFCLHFPWDGFAVRYTSPTSGEIDFAWTPRSRSERGLLVDGTEVDLHPEPVKRWDSPWAQAGWNDGVYHAEAGGWSLDLDFAAGTRSTSGP